MNARSIPGQCLRAARTLAIASALSLLGGCGGDGGSRLPAPGDSLYAVRGEIVQLPAAGGKEILIRHEAIPELRDSNGKVVGMDSMTMPFTLGPTVDRTTLVEGGRYEFTLEVRWNAVDPIVVREFSPLATGTRLGFDPPEPATPVVPSS